MSFPREFGLISNPFTAKTLVKTACAQNRAPLVIKDISWLWRTAYNCAVQGCSEWSNAEERTPALFDLSREVRSRPESVNSLLNPFEQQLLEMYREATMTELDETSHLCIIHGSFAAVLGRGEHRS